MGYLVRNAIEDAPNMSSLMTKNHRWMAAVIDAENFEQLSDAVAESLDDFMRNVYLHGQNRINKKGRCPFYQVVSFSCSFQRTSLSLTSWMGLVR